MNGPSRAMIAGFRGVGKSWIAAVLCLALLLRNPQLNIVVVSASKHRSDAFTQFCLKLIDEVPELRHLRPRENQRRSMVCFDVGPARAAQAASVLAVGITGQMTGARADIIIADDIEVANNSETVDQREKLAEKVKEFEALLKPGGRILYLGTPQTEDSIYNRLPERGYTIRIWPILYPDEKQTAAYDGRLAPLIRDRVAADPSLIGRSTEPTRFTDLDIEGRRLSYGPAGFALQYMLDPRLADEDQYPLKLKDAMVMSLDPRAGPERVLWASGPDAQINDLPCVGMRGDRWNRALLMKDTQFVPYTGVVMFIDPAGRGKDETAYAVVASLHGTLFVLDVGGFHGYDTPVLEALANAAKDWGVNLIEVEPNFGDGMFAALMRPVLGKLYPVAIRDSERPRGQKEARIIDTLRPVLQGHRLVINSQLIEKDYRSVSDKPPEEAVHYRLVHQLTRITRERGCLKHDDRLDALAGAVHYWKSTISADSEKAAKAARERQQDEELRKFARHALGGEPRRPRWASRP